MRQPFSTPAKHGVFLEIGAMAEEDAYPDATGNIPIELKVEELFSEWLEAGKILDAVICKSEAQRSEMWDRRERAYEVGLLKGVPVACDISVAVDKVDDFLTKVKKRVYALNGGENNILHGDQGSEAFLSEIIGATSWRGQRHWNMESIYEYGSKAGFWRLARIFQKANFLKK